MADGLAVAFINGVVGKLGEIAVEKALNEASLLFNFKSDFKWLKNKLRQLSSSLQAADQVTHGHTEPGVKDWLAEVRNIVFDAEDIIDEYVVEHLYTNTSQSCVCSRSQLVFQYKMGKRIRELKGRIRSTIEEAERLKLFHDVAHLSQPSTSITSTSTSGGEELRRPSVDPDHQDSPAVAIDYKVDEILTLLENPSIRVVAVLGMGGLGKTFLMQHVFNRIKHSYVYSAWISVSQSSSLRSLQNDLASHIGLDIDTGVSDARALELIYNKLVGNRCLIVLDDVWSNSVQGSLISRIGFPGGGNSQCKIVVTTRSRDVAESMNAHVYEMQHPSEDESWNLFCSFAFPHCEGNRPPQKLEILARGIVQECGRLPLALKTVAASLAKPSLTSTDWESKLGQLKKIRKTEDFVMKILKLSYDSLPPNLKSCFAYLSFFPEDTHISISSFRVERAIHQEYVIYLWIAEGCIPQEEDREQFDTGLDYLHQFENLCLLEVNRIYSCYSVHDLLLDLAVDISKEHECEFDLPSKETKCRRLLLSKKSLDNNAISERPLRQQPFLRTLSFSQNSDITSIPEQLLDHARLLRVIDFSRTAISTLPKCVGNLKLLKVLNLSNTEIEEVPDCVRRLKSLQFLDVSYCKTLRSVPDWIGELNCLSYLDAQWCSDELSWSRKPKGLSQLLSLRTLKSGLFTLDAEDNEFLNVKDVGRLVDLREISFCLEDVGALRSIEDGALDRLVKMRNLSVENNIPAGEGDGEESSLPAFPEKLSVMKGLQQLQLTRFSVPNWICGMENLTQLILDECGDYSSLQKMHSLEFLSLDDDSKCRELPKNFGERGGFPKLFKLQIKNFSSLEELPALEEGAMQRLEMLLIMNCPLVERVPDGLERLRRLKRIKVVKASGMLERRLKEGGEDWSKIKAINPRIGIFLE